MTSVLDDPSARLYAGALLGSALAKELGTVGAQQNPVRAVAARRATLTAGIASGKINPRHLSSSDAGLLGSALSGHVHVPSLLSDPIGFLGGLGENFIKGAGQAVGSLKGVPQAVGEELLNVVKPPPALGGEKTKHPIAEGVRQFPKQVAHDFSSPSQLYKNPFAPVLDVASVVSPGLSAANKIATASRLAKAAELAKTGETIGAPTGLSKALINLGSPEGRSPAPLSPSFGEKAISDVVPKTAKRYYATQRPFMKYAVQKPADLIINQLQRAPLIGPKLYDLRAGYYGRKLAARTHGQEVAGTSETLANHPVNDLIEATRRMYRGGQAAGQYQFEATVLHSLGINDLPKLDEYVNQIHRGQEVDGIIVSPDMQKMANYRADTLYQDERFRNLIEHPTDRMKEVAYHMRRVNVENARKLGISPQVSEEAALSRLAEMTGKTPEEIRAELPTELKPQGEFAKGLYNLQESILGKPLTEDVPSIQELTSHLPYGTVPQRVSILERAFHSLVADVKGEGSVLDRLKDPSYLAGNNLFEKVAGALHDELGVAREQAQAFARGIALGSENGPILPTYVPSVSGEKLKFGIRPDTLGVKVGRTLGLSRFKALEQAAPAYYDFPRPFSPRTVSAETLGLSPAQHYLKEATQAPFLTGTQRMDPESIIRNTYQINKDIVKNKLSPAMLDKMNLENPEAVPGVPDGLWTGPGEMFERLGTKAALYDFVPVDTYRNYFTTQHEMQIEMANEIKGGALEDEIERLAEESAQKFVNEETTRAAHGHTFGVVVPKTFVKTIAAHARLSEQATGAGRMLSSPVAVWKTAVLSFSPAWLARTSIGHGIIALVDGTTDPRYWVQSHKYFAEDRPVLPEQVKALDRWKDAGDRILNPEPLPFGVNQGGLQQELSDIQGGSRGMGDLYMPRKISSGVHVQNNFQRRAVYLRKLDVGAKQRMAEVGTAFEHPGGFWNAKNIDAVLDPAWRAEVLKYPDLVEHAFDQLSQVSYTFSQMNPWERTLVRYGVPFYGWRKFITKFVWSMPINYPGRTAALYALGKIGENEHESLGPMPDYLSGALWFDHNDLSKARYVNLYGLNPFSDPANPLGEGGALGGLVNLGQTSPVIQSVLAGLGINPLTGENESVDPSSGIEQDRFGNYYDIKTGQPTSVMGHDPIQRLVGSFLRTFPEVRTAEIAITGGNPVYPESIPFINERPVPVNPQTRRDNSPISLIGQELGVQPRSMDLRKFQANQQKSLSEARKKNPKTVAKAKNKLKIPSVP